MAVLAIRLSFVFLVIAYIAYAHENGEPYPSNSMNSGITLEQRAVAAFIDYLKIRTDHPNPQYRQAVLFLLNQARELKLEVEVLELEKNYGKDESGGRTEEGFPLVLFTAQGTDPTLPAVLFNSHMDVVPTEPSKWTYDPFGGTKDSEGRIYGRGSQDMKSVGIQQIYALATLFAADQPLLPLRTIYVVFVPDEEIGGTNGWGRFIKTRKWRNMNVGLVVDEGLANPDYRVPVFYGERAPWWTRAKAIGPPGHGSSVVPNTAIERVIGFTQRLLTFRDEQVADMKEKGLEHGDIITINPTVLKAGVPKNDHEFIMNVIPSQAEIGFDIRMSPFADFAKFEKQLKQWASEFGMDLEFVHKVDHIPYTALDETNIWWPAFKAAAAESNITLVERIFPASTDCRYARSLGIPALGFSPMPNTPVLLHDHNEYLEEDTFVKGIGAFAALMKHLSAVLPPAPLQLAPPEAIQTDTD